MQLSKLSLLISGFSFIIMAGARILLGAWHPYLYFFLAVFVLGIIVSVALDYKIYLEFLSIKTAKKGLSLGWSLLLLIVFLVGAGYLGNRFNKTFDLTEEGINSLAEQTTDALKNLDSELAFLVFFNGDKISDELAAFKRELKNDLGLYKQNSSKIKVTFVDTYKNPLKAEEYLSNLPDKNQQELFVFVNYKGRKIRVDEPFSEEDLTSAIIKTQKRELKEILFLTGHGEKNINDEKTTGLKILNQSLTDSGFVLKEWNFIQMGPPKDPVSMVMVVGPSQPFLPAELAWLTEHLSQGGKLFLSLDPKEKHGFQDWLKDYGVIFNNDFIVSLFGLQFGSPTKAIGSIFDTTNPITRRFSERQAVLFDQASSIDIEPSTSQKFNIANLVKSHDKSISAPELTQRIKVENVGSLIMAVEVKPKPKDSSKNPPSDKKTDAPSPSSKDFHMILTGDSDFLSNRYIYEGANRDFVLNALVALAGEEELISIRPKRPKGTKITLLRAQKAILLIFYFTFPFIFLLIGLWIWFRRRSL